MNSDLQSSLVPKNALPTTQIIAVAEGERSFAPRTANTMQELLRLVLKRRWWLISAVILSVAASIFYSMVKKPVYASTVVIELNKSNSGASALEMGDELSSGLMGDADTLLTDLQTETSILESDALAADVIQHLNLMAEPPYSGILSDPHAHFDKQHPLTDPEVRAQAVDVFHGHLRVQPVRGTRLIEVTYEDHDARKAAVIANALIDSYKNQYLESHYTASSEASDWLTKQLADLKRDVEDSEKKLTDFEKETGILTFDMVASSSDKGDSGSGQAHSVVIQKLDALNAELTTAEANRIEKEAIYRFTKSGNPDTILAIGNDPLAVNSNSAVLSQAGGLTTLGNLRQQEGSLRLALADASTKYGANNRHLKDLQSQVHEIDLQMSEEVARIASRAEMDYKLAKQAEDAIRQQFQQQQGEANKVNSKAVELSVLSQEAASRKKLYEDLYTKLQEANISAGIKATNITVVDAAWPQPDPVRPNLRKNMTLGLVFGLFFGIFAAFVADNLDRRITTPTQVEEITGRTVVGTIPQFEESLATKSNRLMKVRSNGNGSLLPTGPQSVWVLSRPKSAIAEACRSLRTSVLLARAGGGPKVILVTSSVPGEGKTTLTANLAVAFAQHNKRVLVMEADMRRPSLKRVLGIESSSGLSNILTNGGDFDAFVVRQVAVPGLDVLPSGPVPPLPSEILDSAAFDDLLAVAKSQYDFIFIDSPPATVVTDAISLGLRADGVLWITRAGAATKPLVERASEIVAKYRLPLIGYVMNGVDIKSADYRYGYYGYSGASGYYDEKNS